MGMHRGLLAEVSLQSLFQLLSYHFSIASKAVLSNFNEKSALISFLKNQIRLLLGDFFSLF
jgi:hypothetical protein